MDFEALSKNDVLMKLVTSAVSYLGTWLLKYLAAKLDKKIPSLVKQGIAGSLGAAATMVTALNPAEAMLVGIAGGSVIDQGVKTIQRLRGKTPDVANG